LGVLNQTDKQVPTYVNEIMGVQQKMAESLQNIMSVQNETLSVVNNINTVVTNTRTLKNVISGVMISAVKNSLKVAFFGSVGMPWMMFKGLAQFSLSGGKRLFGPLVAILSIVCFIIQMGNVCYMLTIPCEDFLVPNKYSAVQAKYPMIDQSKDRFSIVDKFKTDVVKITDVIDVSYLDFKYHNEGYNILKNMSMYDRIYHKSPKIPQIMLDELSTMYELQQYAFFRGTHMVIDLATNIERSSNGYKRAVEELVGESSVVEWYDTATYKTQMSVYEQCTRKVSGIMSGYICGDEPIFNSNHYNQQQEKQNNYVKWESCNDYNNNLNKITTVMWKQDCGVKPPVYDPTKKFVDVLRKKTIGKFIMEKGSLYTNPNSIKKHLNSD
jgi:hypothetical protein